MRTRRLSSIKSELLKKSREAALTGVQVFNNPNILFKSESFVILMIIAWTYFMHAYYRDKGIEYRYFKIKGKRRKFDKTKHGAFKHWELERCLDDSNCPIDTNTKNNLKFLIGLRHEIEHQMTTKIDDLLSARFQACCLNYNANIKKNFGDDYSIEKLLSFSIQFSTISTKQKEMLEDHKDLPANIQGYIKGFDESLTEAEYADARYAYRLFFIPKLANHKGQADRVFEFVRSDSPLAESLNKEIAYYKEIDKSKFLPKQIVDLMIAEGYDKFSMQIHTTLWKQHDAKNPKHKFGVLVATKHWLWYENWVGKVREYCEANKDNMRSKA